MAILDKTGIRCVPAALDGMSSNPYCHLLIISTFLKVDRTD